MTKLEQYKDRYENIRMERRNGILQLTFHTEGESLKWSVRAHRDCGRRGNRTRAKKVGEGWHLTPKRGDDPLAHCPLEEAKR